MAAYRSLSLVTFITLSGLKDWAEILLTQKRYGEAEEKIRQVLELLEEKDSDALFSLGVILSEAGKDDESIEAYTKSVKLNAEDVELCYNLGIKLGAKGDIKGEMAMVSNHKLQFCYNLMKHRSLIYILVCSSNYGRPYIWWSLAQLGHCPRRVGKHG